eukprot:scaffold4235_cov114-Isochrysis_galbana.AAC.10
MGHESIDLRPKERQPAARASRGKTNFNGRTQHASVEASGGEGRTAIEKWDERYEQDNARAAQPLDHPV